MITEQNRKKFNANLAQMRKLQQLKENVQISQLGETAESKTLYEDLLSNIEDKLRELDEEQRRLVNGD